MVMNASVQVWVLIALAVLAANLPFLSQRRRLRHPIPLGEGRLLQGWLPRSYEEQRLLDLDALLAADSLADLLKVMMQGAVQRDRRVQVPAA